jgi:hypothetical protein
MPEANQATSLGEAIAALLRCVPDLWEPVPDGNLEALARLTAAGFIERRVTFTIKLPGDDKPQRITIELTGEYGLVEAMTGVLQDLWARCGERWRELRAEIGEPIKPIVALERDEWRMTDQGRLARDDLKRDATVPIDFALKRGFFNSRGAVRGQGRLVRIENAASGPLAVDLAKCSAAPEIAQALAAAFAELLKAKQTAENPAPTPATDAPSLALLRVFTNGIVDERIRQARRILADDTLTANEKLTRIDELIPFPPTASAEQLSAMLGVTKQAVMKTSWWRKNRRGMTDEEIERRQLRLKDRGRKYERPRSEEDDAEER